MPYAWVLIKNNGYSFHLSFVCSPVAITFRKKTIGFVILKCNFKS